MKGLGPPGPGPMFWPWPSGGGTDGIVGLGAECDRPSLRCGGICGGGTLKLC